MFGNIRRIKEDCFKIWQRLGKKYLLNCRSFTINPTICIWKFLEKTSSAFILLILPRHTEEWKDELWLIAEKNAFEIALFVGASEMFKLIQFCNGTLGWGKLRICFVNTQSFASNIFHVLDALLYTWMKAEKGFSVTKQYPWNLYKQPLEEFCYTVDLFRCCDWLNFYACCSSEHLCNSTQIQRCWNKRTLFYNEFMSNSKNILMQLNPLQLTFTGNDHVSATRGQTHKCRLFCPSSFLTRI